MVYYKGGHRAARAAKNIKKNKIELKTNSRQEQKNTSGMFESLAWVSSKLLKVTDADARSQQLLHLVIICDLIQLVMMTKMTAKVKIIMLTKVRTKVTAKVKIIMLTKFKTIMMSIYPVQPSSQVASQPMCQRENTATMSCKSYLYA